LAVLAETIRFEESVQAKTPASSETAWALLAFIVLENIFGLETSWTMFLAGIRRGVVKIVVTLSKI
jgi:hypothetical protein